MSQTSAPGRHARAIPLRFSLRALMLLVLASAVGMAYWRWPIEVTVSPNLQPVVAQPLSNFLNCGFAVQPGNEVVREVRTCRRGWPGELIQDGLTWSYDDQGNWIVEATWRNGELHGPYRRFDRHGYQYETGQYQHGKRQGSWTT